MTKYAYIDRKRHLFNLMESRIDHWFSEIRYYPFGMVTPGRSFSAGSGYRFGFNGKESDPETYGSGNIYDYGFRIYNPRLGKFLSVDPLSSNYAMLTPYQFASNTPVFAIDLDGLEAVGYGANAGYWWGLSELAVSASEGDDDALMATEIVVSATNKITQLQVTVGFIPALASSGNYAFWWGVRNPYLAIGLSDFTVGLLDPNPPGSGVDIPGPIDDMGKVTRKVITNALGTEVGYLSEDLIKVTARNAKLWGGNDIGMVANKTTTILGKTDDIGFVKAFGLHRSGANKGSLNILNGTKEWNEISAKYKDQAGEWLEGGFQSTRQEFFDTVNKPLLDEAISRGDNFRMVSDPNDISKLVDENGVTVFGMEVQHLIDNGYTFINGTAVKQ